MADQPRFKKEAYGMAKGTVKWFNPDKGFGFIAPDDGSKDVFLHISEVEKANLDSIREGTKLEYEIEDGRNGKKQAAKIKLA